MRADPATGIHLETAGPGITIGVTQEVPDCTFSPEQSDHGVSNRHFSEGAMQDEIRQVRLELLQWGEKHMAPDIKSQVDVIAHNLRLLSWAPDDLPTRRMTMQNIRALAQIIHDHAGFGR